MPIRKTRPIHVSCIIERLDNHLLIALGKGAGESARHWQFPRGAAQPAETTEAAMRRVAHEQLGLSIEIVVGQPPVVSRIDGEEIELRYFFCGIMRDSATDVAPEDKPSTGLYAEIQWIPKIHLREYDFDESSTPVVEWLLEEQG